jgi:nucleoid-associated protein YgaU
VSFRLLNSADRSVHPTGMAVDLRKPTKRRCLTWLRETLLYLEAAGALEATEEHRPPHFHVAVYPGPYRRYVARSGRSGGEERTASRSSGTRRATPARTTYRVRQGDSLWAIARRHGTSVERLKNANDMRSNRLRPGQVLVIPGR